MAGFLRKTSDDSGSVLWTSARDDGTGKPITDVEIKGTPSVQLSGSKVAEQKTQTNAVSGTLTFTQNIEEIEIFNTDATNAGVFTVNGIAINVPANTPFQAKIGGTPAKTVNITGSTSYIVTRYV